MAPPIRTHSGPLVGHARGPIAIVTTDPLVRTRAAFRMRSRVAIVPGRRVVAQLAATAPDLIVLWGPCLPAGLARRLKRARSLAHMPVIAVLATPQDRRIRPVDDWVSIDGGDHELELRLRAWSRITDLGRRIANACPGAVSGERYLDGLADRLALAEQSGIASLAGPLEELRQLLALVHRLLGYAPSTDDVFDLGTLAREALDRIELDAPWRLSRTRIAWRGGGGPVLVRGNRRAALTRVESLLVQALSAAQATPFPWLGIGTGGDGGDAVLELIAVGLGGALANGVNASARDLRVTIDPDCSAIARAAFARAV